jgi:hypothetical protein
MPPAHHYAWVTLTGRVFVSEDEIEEYLKDNYPCLVAEGKREGTSCLDVCSKFQEKEAFEALAKEKIDALFPMDDPMKISDVHIDLETYR